MDNSGKVGLITGGTSGFGRAIAEKMAQQGAQVVITGRSEARVQETAAQLGVKGVAADVSRPEDWVRVRDLLERASIQQPVLVAITDGTAEVTLNLMVAFGARVPALAEKVQKNVKSAIQNMTGVTVSRVNIVIAGVAGTSAPAAG